VLEASPEPDLDAFYRRIFLPLVRRVTWRFGLSKEDARDIVQDAFVLAVPRIDLAGKPKAWLIQVVDHLATNHWRKTVRRAELVAKWAPGETGSSCGDDDSDGGDEVEY
jgi:DNA-directed RNA polymerase specialized sigma24 family protein